MEQGTRRQLGFSDIQDEVDPPGSDSPTGAGTLNGPGDNRLRDLLVEFRDKFGVPALGGAVVHEDGAIDADVIGTRSRDTSERATLDDQWHIGSCAKAITAALYARLVEEGLTNWGAPIRDLFSDLESDLDGAWSEPTVAEVLVCRSGMKPNLSPREMLSAWKDLRPTSEQRTQAAVLALARPPRSRGTFRYSNLGYIVVGAAIDRIAGMPFEDALHHYIFEPLGITSAGLGPPPDIWGHKSRLRLGPLLIGKGSPVDPAMTRSDNPAVMTPAGRLHLTLADWARLQLMFLPQGAGLLSPASIDHLFRLPAGKGRGMAMGWAPTSELEQGTSYGMQGSNTLWAATALIDSDFERTVMVVANDGRTKILRRSAQLAARILQAG